MSKFSFRSQRYGHYHYVAVMDDFGNDCQVHRMRVNHFIAQTH